LISLILAWIVLTSATPSLPITINLPKATYQPGSYTIPSTPFPSGASLVMLTLTPVPTGGSMIILQADISPDNGTTWVPFGAMTVTTETATHGRFPCAPGNGCNPASSTQRIRGTAVIQNVAVTVGGSIVIQ
jgi:hypothetical protein